MVKILSHLRDPLDPKVEMKSNKECLEGIGLFHERFIGQEFRQVELACI